MLNEIVRVFGYSGHPNNIRLLDAMGYLIKHYNETKALEIAVYFFGAGVLYIAVKRFRNLPWFLIVFVLALIVGVILEDNPRV